FPYTTLFRSQADVKDVQAFTTCFALDYSPGEDFVQKPANYAFWSSYVPAIQPAWSGRLLDLHYSNPRTLQPKRLGFDPRPGVSVEERSEEHTSELQSRENLVCRL